MRSPDILRLEPGSGRMTHPRLPVVIHRRVLAGAGREGTASAFERLFAANAWPPRWRDGIFGYHHYHSTAHEALGVAGGEARVQLGGPGGEIVALRAGDVLVLPAGTGHRRVRASPDFLVVGAYPRGQDYDLRTQPPTPAILARIEAVPMPAADPAHGGAGPLPGAWEAGEGTG
ncbi:hypothetical protein [Luteimonas huabeiensis]|uniref:hypothetical protein n=1 Tax=Luteimonas huabeiensis TaxID=1244513 RepID=UPI0004660B2C|nr:hypothetical protein [Luteimonas huabeiensis]